MSKTDWRWGVEVQTGVFLHLAVLALVAFMQWSEGYPLWPGYVQMMVCYCLVSFSGWLLMVLPLGNASTTERALLSGALAAWIWSGLAAWNAYSQGHAPVAALLGAAAGTFMSFIPLCGLIRLRQKHLGEPSP